MFCFADRYFVVGFGQLGSLVSQFDLFCLVLWYLFVMVFDLLVALN